jgi:hypothetical protein
MAACKLTNNSGKEVAKETTVNPITSFDNFNLNDNATEERTKYSPPTTNSRKPIIIKTILIKINFCEDKVLKTVTNARFFNIY